MVRVRCVSSHHFFERFEESLDFNCRCVDDVDTGPSTVLLFPCACTRGSTCGGFSLAFILCSNADFARSSTDNTSMAQGLYVGTGNCFGSKTEPPTGKVRFVCDRVCIGFRLSCGITF